MAIELAKAYVQVVPTTTGLGDSITSAFKSAGDAAGRAGGTKAGLSFSGALGTATKASGAAIAAAATAVGSIVKSSIEGFSEYEQLVGGAQLMFGEAYDAVAARAANAYATVQMSQNEYLQQANGFATGLKTALGGNEQAAADLADRIITAEADIVAATGNSQEAVQNAFNGIMKSNFTMLDNLQLGITPTQEGFQALIDKVNEWNAANGEATNYQMGNLADMQSALVDYVEMQGLAGYAANEASETIQGSLASTKAAWDNLLVGMADGSADIGSLIDNLVDSAGSLLENLIPVAEQALQGVASLIGTAAPMIVEELPGLVSTILPSLLESAMSIVDGIIAALPGLLQIIIATLIGFLPDIIQAGLDLFLGLIGALPEIIATITAALPEIITSICTTLAGNTPAIVQAGVQLLTSLVQNLPLIIANLMTAVPQIISSLINGIVGAIPQMVGAGYNLMTGLIQGIRNAVSLLWETMVSAVQGVINAAKRILRVASPSKVFEEIGGYTMEGFAEGILRNEDLVSDAMRSASDLATGSFTSTLTVNAAAADRAAPASSQAAIAQEIAAALRNVRVYIDGQRMVGYLVPAMDTALGARQLAAERGAI